ncbi:hypothetical protein A2954_01010 [Candidatus Roizmanbacteria bacterium RIFCSPLOWO2_01_FULL_37_12]|uniref:Methylated-DNA-[protein]-cysteine S-methyltransferase DNA binding domain-containing protein n=1 Tax=Candidatus Roizmanbacteria bacterium RIFCSPLOWO2_01_FULL_37_12 TaxID=1802056 RepID=A0A1F7IGC0_9BACT|nr:MAG: hypothetical protein A3D76_00235 [Candidatus Roizmanbacteria bacterium RIFCSPHIGHO2_02_FULL_37_9b]OGK42406.1 MAG: hypothetical protein A2954_01010 [Candidatus Roizmanbacteria bacterium RIFCSPLOWO2_01_FULL_37_12]
MKKSFKEKVYELCRAIPKGKVATYGQIARLADKPKAARAVGAYMRMNPDSPNTPCHRVVASDGSLTGYSGTGGVTGKKKMLLAEGVNFIGSRVNLSWSKWNN